MKLKIAARCFLAGTLALPLAAYPGDRDSDRSSPVAFVKDSVITAEIKARLAAEELASLKNISVDTDSRGIVTLSGTVKTRKEANKAASIARHVEGVAAVEDRIVVAARK